MSFKSYAYRLLPDGGMVFTDPQPLVFSGRQGLIARFVFGPECEAEKPWRLCAGQLHALATPAFQVRDRLIVFEQAESNTLELLILEAVHGISAERTDMMFRFRPLKVVSQTPHLQVEHVEGGKIYTEELSLEGGATAPAASWHWRRPHLALGGVVCGAGASR